MIRYFFDYYKRLNFIKKNRISAIISLIISIVVSFFKVIIGVYTSSFIWIYSAIYTIFLAISKQFVYIGIKNELKNKPSNMYILLVSITLLVSGFAFMFFMIFRLFNVSEVITLKPLMLVIASIYLSGTIIFAFYNLIHSRKYENMIIYSYKIIGLSCAILNIVLLQRLIISYFHLTKNIYNRINIITGFLLSLIIIGLAFKLFIKYIELRKEEKKGL